MNSRKLTGDLRALRPYLVVIRAGRQSLHTIWMDPQSPRSWDLLIDYYEKLDSDHDDLADFINEGGITKFSSMHALDRTTPDFLRSYRAICFLDDDIEIAFQDIDRMFTIFSSFGLWLAQPSLTADSFYTYPMTVNCDCFVMRYTNFVEIMAPIMSQETFVKLVGTFNESISGYGLDDVWPKILGYPRDRIAILDAVTARHTKKIDHKEGAFYRFLRSMEVDPFAEMKNMAMKYDITAEESNVRSYSVVPRFSAASKTAAAR